MEARSHKNNNVEVLLILTVILLLIIFTQRIFLKPIPESQTIINQAKPTVTQDISPTNPIPTSSISIENQINTLTLQYPNSQQLRSQDNTIVLESNDDPQLITDWYKEKINSLEMNVKSSVETKTNDTISNKLNASDEDKEIKVEISKLNSQSKVKISITLLNINSSN